MLSPMPRANFNHFENVTGIVEYVEISNQVSRFSGTRGAIVVHGYWIVWGALVIAPGKSADRRPVMRDILNRDDHRNAQSDSRQHRNGPLTRRLLAEMMNHRTTGQRRSKRKWQHQAIGSDLIHCEASE